VGPHAQGDELFVTGQDGQTLAGVRQEWESYERVIVADPWSDGEPAPKLLALRRELLSTLNE
jgi:hypothetical protein